MTTTNSQKFSYASKGFTRQGTLNPKTKNQDRYHIYHDKKSHVIIVSIADGHGASVHYRSDKGAEFAVIAAREVFLKFVNDTYMKYGEKATSSAVRSFTKNTNFSELSAKLKQEILKTWLKHVQNDIQKNPLEEENFNEQNERGVFVSPKTKQPNVLDIKKELSSLTKNSSEILDEKFLEIVQSSRAKEKIQKKVTEVKKNESRPYGTTLVSTLIFPYVSIAFKIGDGNLLISFDGVTAEEFFANETDRNTYRTFSLANNNPELMNLSFIKRPKLVLLASDGISNSFAQETDIFELTHYMFTYNKNLEDLKKANKFLKEIVMKCASKGSKDDSTLIYVFEGSNNNEQQKTKSKGA